jgi:hypoxanthine phosphoribosyltransferase
MDERVEDAIEVRRRARLLHSGVEIDRALSRMAAALSQQVADRNPIIVAVMHGGVFAAVELCRRLNFPHEFDYIQLSRYRDSTQGGRLDWIVRPTSQCQDRVVVLVDDILDRGETLQAAQAAFRALPVQKLYTAVLVSKRTQRSAPEPEVDFIGVEVDDEFVFGSGMDYRGYWREVPGLYAVV